MQELSPLLIEASALLIVGMLFVSVFLGLLIFVIRILAKFAPSAHVVAGASKRTLTKRIVNNDPNKLNPSIVAAISAAVNQYRNKL